MSHVSMRKAADSVANGRFTKTKENFGDLQAKNKKITMKEPTRHEERSQKNLRNGISMQ